MNLLPKLFFLCLRGFNNLTEFFFACVVLFLIQSADRLVLCLGCLWIKLKGIKPVPEAGVTGKGSDDVEAGATGDFPTLTTDG